MCRNLHIGICLSKWGKYSSVNRRAIELSDCCAIHNKLSDCFGFWSSSTSMCLVVFKHCALCDTEEKCIRSQFIIETNLGQLSFVVQRQTISNDRIGQLCKINEAKFHLFSLFLGLVKSRCIILDFIYFDIQQFHLHSSIFFLEKAVLSPLRLYVMPRELYYISR